MKYGLFCLMNPREAGNAKRIVDDTIVLVRKAEELGFETAWFAEHHFSNYSDCPSPLVMSAYCAGVTRTIKLGTAVLVLPLYHPVRMLEEIGLVDMLSNGRLVIGVGTGYQTFEFERFGVDLNERVARSLEMLDILELYLAHEELEYEGTHYRLPRMPICARTLDQRRPEIYVAGAQPELVERVVRHGYKPFVTVGYKGVDALLEQRRHYEGFYRKAGIAPSAIPFAIQRYVYVTDSRADALDAAERILYITRVALSMRFGYQQLDGALLRPLPFKDEPSLEEIVDNVIVGDAEHCAEKLLSEIAALSPSHVSCFMQFGGLELGRALRSIERFGAEVMPLVERALTAPLGADRSRATG